MVGDQLLVTTRSLTRLLGNTDGYVALDAHVSPDIHVSLVSQ